MAINCLWPFLKNCSRKVNLREFSGQTAAIDASCWIHRALYVTITERGNRERFGNTFQRYLQTAKNAGVRPFVVFDGLPLPAKAAEDERRKREREDRRNKVEEENLTSEEANRLRGQAVSVTFDDIYTCINASARLLQLFFSIDLICLSEGVKYIVSPYESDAQIAFLLGNDCADFAITEDSDLLVYGCKKVMVKTSMSGVGECFVLSHVLESLKLSMNEFRKVCIAAGCDYLKNGRGIGIQRAFKMVAAGKLMELLGKGGAPEDYWESFLKAEAVFQPQTVFNLGTCSTVPLEKWETNPPVEIQYLCGEYPLDTNTHIKK
ncbi:unnamed protein product [Porites evermanni]|uniref:Exonuclease 1 n=1 Tax=Porites evermanni TaxID=104178 RepID=A0ABN8SIN8_9CNID|nr:unnamed protein product [Porites evermanni]